MIQHGEVDIFQASKTVRRHRPQLIENIVSRTAGGLGIVLSKVKGDLLISRFVISFYPQTEYKYCYDLVLHYVLHYLNKDLKEKK